jgi:hypothetical protein
MVSRPACCKKKGGDCGGGGASADAKWGTMLSASKFVAYVSYLKPKLKPTIATTNDWDVCARAKIHTLMVKNGSIV